MINLTQIIFITFLAIYFNVLMAGPEIFLENELELLEIENMPVDESNTLDYQYIGDYSDLYDDEIISIETAETKQELFERLEQLNLTNIKGKQKKAKFDYLKTLEVVPDSVTKPFVSIIKKKSILFSLKQNKQFKLPRAIYVKGIVYAKDPQAFYLQDKKGNIEYKTHIQNTQSIEKDVDLLPTPKIIESYRPPERNITYDDNQRFEAAIKYHYEIISADFFNEIWNVDKSQSVANRFELNAFLVWDNPLNFGFNINYQNGGWIYDENFQAKWAAIFIGPQIRYKIYKSDNLSLFSSTSFQKDISFSLTDSSYKFKSNVLQFDVELIYKHFILGGAYRYYEIELSRPKNISVNANRNRMTSLSLSFGYKVNLSL